MRLSKQPTVNPPTKCMSHRYSCKEAERSCQSGGCCVETANAEESGTKFVTVPHQHQNILYPCTDGMYHGALPCCPEETLHAERNGGPSPVTVAVHPSRMGRGGSPNGL